MPEAQATPSSYFVAELGGEQIGAFREIKGLNYETKVIEVRTVDAEGRPVLQKASGASNTSAITISRYADDKKIMFDWAKEVAEKGAAAAKRDITFRRVSYEGETIETFTLVDAWPSKYDAALLSAEQNAAAVEEVKIEHTGFRKV
jgi:phage tail-like protein